jgi:hypothetical protein
LTVGAERRDGGDVAQAGSFWWFAAQAGDWKVQNADRRLPMRGLRHVIGRTLRRRPLGPGRPLLLAENAPAGSLGKRWLFQRLKSWQNPIEWLRKLARMRLPS